MISQLAVRLVSFVKKGKIKPERSGKEDSFSCTQG
jgi:hypothetical protein